MTFLSCDYVKHAYPRGGLTYLKKVVQELVENQRIRQVLTRHHRGQLSQMLYLETHATPRVQRTRHHQNVLLRLHLVHLSQAPIRRKGLNRGRTRQNISGGIVVSPRSIDTRSPAHTLTERGAVTSRLPKISEARHSRL